MRYVLYAVLLETTLWHVCSVASGKRARLWSKVGDRAKGASGMFQVPYRMDCSYHHTLRSQNLVLFQLGNKLVGSV